MATIIVLNGTSSAGKTTLARAIQVLARRPFLHVQMDEFIEMQPPRLDNHPDGFVFRRVDGVEPAQTMVTTGPLGQRLLSGMRGAVAALADAGNDIIVDDVWMNNGEQDAYTRLLSGHTARFVGVHAQLEVLEAREIARGDRDVGVARWLLGRTHEGARYDLEVDTGRLDAEHAARRVIDQFDL